MAMSRSIYAAFWIGAIVSVTGRAAAAPAQTLQNHVPKAVGESRRLGPLAGNARMNLAIGLPLRNHAGLDLFLEQVSDPRSRNYRRYLSAGEFTERFGPTQEDYDKLIAFFQANGFAVSGTHPNRMILDVTGPVSAVNKTLHVKMTVWGHPTRGQFFAPDCDPSLDADVAVLNIAGLDNFVLPRPMDLKTAPLTAAKPMTTGSGPNGLFFGNDFRAAYAPGVALTGAGQTVGLFELDGFFAADVTSNFKQAGLPAVPVSTILLDGFSGSPGSENVEVILDIMMAGFMAPGANIIVYEGLAWDDILNRMATDNIAKQLSCSWMFYPIDATTEQIFVEMIAQGQSFFTAAGDYGAYSDGTWPPSDDPNVTSVGGTALTTTGPGGAWVSETTWSGGGGGVSTSYAIPSYQQSLNMAAIGGSNTMRDVPDVALLAAVQIFLICNDGQWVSVGGTSAATPLWAGFMALADQQAAANGNPPVGFLNPTIYAIGQGSDYDTDMHDITTGSNGFPALVGYDLATGWGTPAGQPLINDLTSMPGTRRFQLSAAPSAVQVQAGSSAPANIQIMPEGGFSGAVALSVTGLPTGVTGTFGAVNGSGVSQLILTASSGAAPGNYTLSVQGVSGALSASVGLTLQVTAAPSFSLQATPAAVTVVQGGTGTSSIAVAPANGFNSAVNLTVSGLPSGVTALFSPASTTTASTLSFAASVSAAAGAATVTVTGAGGSLSATAVITLTVAPPANFLLSASASTLSVAQGASATDTITVTPKSGFSGKVVLTAAGLPSGVTASFNPASTATTSIVTVSAASSATMKTVTVTVTGTVGASATATTFSLTVTPPPSFTLGAAPGSLSVTQGTSGTSTITLTPLNGFTGAASLTIGGLPSGVTAAFSPASISSTSKLTLTASASAAVGAATVTITATSGNISARATLALTVAAAPGFSLASSAPNVNVAAGGTGIATITVQPVGGFGGNVALTASGLAAGVTATFSPASTNAASTLTLMAASSAALGASQFTVKGTSGSLTASLTITVTVTPPPSFTVALAPASLSLGQGTSGTNTVTVTPLNGFTGAVSLAITGLPTGVTAAFSPASASSTSTLTLTASASASLGTATATVTGTSGKISANASLALTVSTGPSFTLAAAPATLTVAQGTSGTSKITVTGVNGFKGTVLLAIGGLPTGVTAAFSPGSTSTTSTLTLTASPSASPGTATVTITGTSGNISAKATVALTVVTGPSFTLAAAPASLSIAQGASGTSTVTLTPLNGFTGTVNVAASGLPSGVTAAFSPGSTSTSVALTLAASLSASMGAATVTITGTSGNISAKATIALTVAAAPPSFSLASSAPNVNVAAGSTGTATVSVQALGGFSGSVALTAAGLPAGVTASFSPATTNAASTLTLTAASSAAVGASQFTVKGTSGSLTANLTVTVTVTAATPPNFAVTLAPASLSVVSGANGVTAISITSITGTPGNIVLSATGLPAGVTASFTASGTASSGAGIYLGTFTAGASAAPGTSQVTVTATAGNVSQIAVLNLTVVTPSAGTAPVNLSPYYNVSGSAVDFLPFTGGGLDGGGRSYSGVLLGASQNVGGTVFSLGPMAAPDAVSGQTLTLPAGNYTTLLLLATGVNGNQSGQTFTVTYTDGTTTSFTQSLSDWCTSQNYAGESQAVTMNYRDNSTGTVDVRTLFLYGYSFNLNSAKTVSSIALPQNRNVVVLAVTLAGRANAAIEVRKIG